ncbi:MAG: hypothetical protein KatS3mg110_0606 [Pirellulaceae bacterium]|nr:MAG: hypothetical protein KatS3mg110_0606 [Pirellulaceae bacterium]
MQLVAIFGNKPTDPTRDNMRWLKSTDKNPGWLLRLYRRLMVDVRAEMLKHFPDPERGESPDHFLVFHTGDTSTGAAPVYMGIGPFQVGQHWIGDPVVAGGLFSSNSFSSDGVGPDGYSCDHTWDIPLRDMVKAIRAQWQDTTRVESDIEPTGDTVYEVSSVDGMVWWWPKAVNEGDLNRFSDMLPQQPTLVWWTDLTVDRNMALRICRDLDALVPAKGLGSLILPGQQFDTITPKSDRSFSRIFMAICVVVTVFIMLLALSTHYTMQWLFGPSITKFAAYEALQVTWGGLCASAPLAYWMWWSNSNTCRDDLRLKTLFKAVETVRDAAPRLLRPIITWHRILALSFFLSLFASLVNVLTAPLILGLLTFYPQAILLTSALHTVMAWLALVLLCLGVMASGLVGWTIETIHAYVVSPCFRTGRLGRLATAWGALSACFTVGFFFSQKWRLLRHGVLLAALLGIILLWLCLAACQRLYEVRTWPRFVGRKQN